jgi:lipopolysaccharide export system permease protein
LTREITKTFFIVLAVVITIYLAVDFFENIDSFMKYDIPATRVFWYFLFKTPLVVLHMFPVALLLAVLVTFGIMNKRNELIALKSSGMSIYHLFKSVAVLGVLGAALLFLLSEVVVPAALPHAYQIKGGKKLKSQKNILLKRDRSFLKIGEYDPVSREMNGVTAYFIDGQFHFSKRLDAERARFEEDGWVLEELFEQTFDPDTGVPSVSFHDRQEVSLPLSPDDEDLQQAVTKSEEESCKSLRAKIKKLEAEGGNTLRSRVDLHYKIALPAVCLIMCLIGTGIAVRGKRKEGLPIIISYGLGIAFLYYIAISFCVSIGRAEILPPVVAAWAPHLIFLCVGGVTLINSQQ